MTEHIQGGDDPQPGLVAGRYQVVRPIGRGGMGTVWLATDERLGRSVALKRIGTGAAAGDPGQARAMREARHAASLNHPNVVAVFDVVEHEGASWLVMEHIDGPTLSEAVRKRGAMSPRGAADLGVQLAAALSAAHSVGLVHRDIKPANVLIGDRRAKLADFGTARAGGDDQLTTTGLITGTPTYMAPEVADGHEPSEAADLWALGATLYFAVEGRDAYASQGNALATLRHIATQEPDPPQAAGALGPVIARLMARNPERRGTAASARDDLQRIVSGGEVDATSAVPTAHRASQSRTPSPPAVAGQSRPAASGGGRPVVAGVLLALLLLAALSLAYALLRGEGAPDQSATSGTSTPSSSTRPSSSTSSSSTSSTSTSSTTTSSSTTPSTSTSTPPSSSTSTTPSSSSRTSDPPDEVAFPQDEVSAFLTAHFAQVTADPKQSWKNLTPKFQQENAGGKKAYEEFWGGIESVSVSEISVDEETGVVDLTMTYTPTGRETSVEPKTLTLVRQGQDLRIDDEGSR